MKVILIESVKKLGKKFDEINVKTGFAQNFLFPQKKAVPAVEPFLSEINSMKSEQAADIQAAENAAQALVEKVSGMNLVFVVPANDQGGLYSAIDELLIAEKLAEESEVAADPTFLRLKNPIKEIGDYMVQYVYADDIQAEFTVSVDAEKSEKEEK